MPDSDETPEAPNDRKSPGLFAQLGKGLLRFDIWLGKDPTGRSFKTLAVLVLGTFAAVVFIPLIITPLFLLLGKMGDGIATLGTGEGDVSAAVRNYALLYATLIGAPFLVWRTWLAQRQAQTARENLTLARANAVNETFTKAIEMLGAGTTEAPILEQRLGAIYALERLARDNLDYHVQIMETFCAYLCEHASAKDLKPWPGSVLDKLREQGLSDDEIAKSSEFRDAVGRTGITIDDLGSDWLACLESWKQPAQLFRNDLRAVLDVIDRRMLLQRQREKDKGYRLDLRGLNLQFFEYHGGALEAADLRGAALQGANLSSAVMKDASLGRVQMHGTDLRGAMLDGADLSWAELHGADFSGAFLHGADLSWAEIHETNLSGASMQASNLSWTEVQSSNLSWAKLTGANLQGAVVRQTNLSASEMQGANLVGTKLYEVDLNAAVMSGADLSCAILTGTKDRNVPLRPADLSGVRCDGGAFRFADFRDTSFGFQDDFQNSFGDGSVITPSSIRRPPQWSREELPDTRFWRHWRGWLEVSPSRIEWRWLSPKGLESISAIPPPEGCEWKTGPLNPE